MYKIGISDLIENMSKQIIPSRRIGFF